MKTLSFREAVVARKPTEPLLQIDSPNDGIELKPGLQLIVAPNGYGKTTFLQSVAGLLPLVRGQLVLGDKILRPDSSVLYVSEYLTFPKFIYPGEWIDFMSEGETRADLIDWTKRFSLIQQMSRYLGRLSQGERRKVTWLGAHASKRPVLLLDEPLDGLDLLAIRAAREMLAEWKREDRIVAIVAHQVGEVLDLADEVFLVRERKLVRWRDVMKTGHRDAPPEEFRQRVLEFYSSQP